VEASSAEQATESGRRTTFSSGLLTGLSTLAVTGSAAASGVVLAQEFGRGDRTDGFFLAYAVYLVLTLAAASFRIVALPALTVAEVEGRLPDELGRQAVALALVAVPAVVLGAALAHPLGDAVASREAASAAFASGLPWMVAAGALQLYAALLASALAARDSYGRAAAAYALGAVLGLAVFVALRSHGVVSLAWGLLVNGAVTAGILGAAVRPRLSGLAGAGRRVALLGQGVALPVALQALYAVANAFAVRLGSGEATEFGYAYFVASALVAATASALGLVSSAPLTRRGLSPESAARHVVHMSWLSLAPIVAGVGVFALVGARLVHGVLGESFGGDVAHDLGRLVVWTAPWMLVSTALTLTYPLLFVLEPPRVLVGLALALPLLHVPVAWALSEWLELRGLALALALSTGLALAVLMSALSARAAAIVGAGVARLALVEVGAGALAFGVCGLLVGGVAAAVLGLVLYAGLLVLVRHLGLGAAWEYLRALH
jgi:hypothetical protein